MHGVTQTVNGGAPTKSGLAGAAQQPIDQTKTGFGNSLLPAQGTQQDLMARTLAAQMPYDQNGVWRNLGGQLGTLLGGPDPDLARRQADNAYNAGGQRYGDVWSINYNAVAQTPEPYIAAGIAKANPDGTYTMLKLQDKETQQWIPIDDFYKKYPTG